MINLCMKYEATVTQYSMNATLTVHADSPEEVIQKVMEAVRDNMIRTWEVFVDRIEYKDGHKIKEPEPTYSIKQDRGSYTFSKKPRDRHIETTLIL